MPHQRSRRARWDKGAAGKPPGVRRVQQAAEHVARTANAPPPPATAPVVRRGTQPPPPRPKNPAPTPAPAPRQCRRRWLSSQPSPTPCQVVTTFKQQQASKPHLCGHASRSELRHGQACRADAVEQARRDKDAAGAPPGVRRIQQATEHRAGAANAPPPLAARACRATGQAAAAATLQRSGSGSGSEPVPPAARPNPGRRLVRSSPLSSSSRRRNRAYADRPAGPSCAVGKHATPTQSARLAGTRGAAGQPPKLRQVSMQPSDEPLAAEVPRQTYLGASRRDDGNSYTCCQVAGLGT
jgi:hypothetical protein